ncbi:MAG TPA: Maf family protein [Gemmatimonadaceae bacterium]|nr:Maf family protein [Gemmatimonadaceae bacterium]
MALWLTDQPLVLASKSEVRRKIIEAAGIPAEVHPAEIDERAIEAGAGDAPSRDVARMLALVKARTVADALPGRLVLGADQTLAFGSETLSKPADLAAASEQLLRMRGLTHELHSAISVARDKTVLFEHVSTARLAMRRFSEDFVDRYLETVGFAALTSVGAYQIEGIGIHLFERIEGDHFTIMGLPLLPLLNFLRNEGFVEA